MWCKTWMGTWLLVGVPQFDITMARFDIAPGDFQEIQHSIVQFGENICGKSFAELDFWKGCGEAVTELFKDILYVYTTWGPLDS